jgi:hypothetical protein
MEEVNDAVFALLQVGLQAARAKLDSPVERGEGVLREVGRGTAVG